MAKPAALNELSGYGYLMFFRFTRDYIMSNGFLSEYDRQRFIGGPAAIFIANYTHTNVGPYSELLFLPGKVYHGRRKRYTISKAYVSSDAGREKAWSDWATVKELADFTFETTGKDIEHIKVSSAGTIIIDIAVKSSGMTFPLSSWFLPDMFSQHTDGKDHLVKIQGSGVGRKAQNLKVEVNPEFFPNFAFFKHLAVLRIDRLRMTAPPVKLK